MSKENDLAHYTIGQLKEIHMKKILFGLTALVLATSNAQAEEIHLMCRSGKNTLRLDIDTTRNHVKIGAGRCQI
jgi:hypothetical protein